MILQNISGIYSEFLFCEERDLMHFYSEGEKKISLSGGITIKCRSARPTLNIISNKIFNGNKSKQAELGVPHSEILVELDWHLNC